jgi:hypothetical protein
VDVEAKGVEAQEQTHPARSPFCNLSGGGVRLIKNDTMR